MAALGMRHVLPLTGDPARVGDQPGAASVYDVNSVAIAKRMNEGFNHAGKSLSSATQFAAAIGFPFWIAFAWFYELTPEGLKRESEIDPDEATAPSKRRKTRSKSSLRARTFGKQ
jgi:5,10-methylenetetrahydrofolate reductase